MPFRDSTDKVLVAKITQSTPSASKSSGDRNFSRAGTQASGSVIKGTRASNTRASNARASNTRASNTSASSRRTNDSQHRGTVKTQGETNANQEDGNEGEIEKRSTNEIAKKARSQAQSVKSGAPTVSGASTVRWKSKGSKNSETSGW